MGWRQANLAGVTGFRLYRNGRLAFDHRTISPAPDSDIYRTDDFAAELVPGQTATYAVSAFGYGRESVTPANLSVVPLAVLGEPAALSLTRPWYDYQAVTIAAGGWCTFTLTSAQWRHHHQRVRGPGQPLGRKPAAKPPRAAARPAAWDTR